MANDCKCKSDGWGCLFFVFILIAVFALDATFDKLFDRLARIDEALNLPPAPAEMMEPEK